jgi:hypothetical protein
VPKGRILHLEYSVKYVHLQEVAGSLILSAQVALPVLLDMGLIQTTTPVSFV